MKDDLSSPSNATKYSYRVYEDGPLTYYHYYFEEIEAPLAPVEGSQPAAAYPKMLPAGLAAVGLLTVAFGSGFAVVNAAHHQSGSASAQPISKSSLKQAPKQKVSVVPSVVPEQVVVTPTALRPIAKSKLSLKSTQVNLKPGLMKLAKGQVPSRVHTFAKVALTQSAIAAPEVTPMSRHRLVSVGSHSPNHSINRSTPIVASAQ